MVDLEKLSTKKAIAKLKLLGGFIPVSVFQQKALDGCPVILDGLEYKQWQSEFGVSIYGTTEKGYEAEDGICRWITPDGTIGEAVFMNGLLFGFHRLIYCNGNHEEIVYNEDMLEVEKRWYLPDGTLDVFDDY